MKLGIVDIGSLTHGRYGMFGMHSFSLRDALRGLGLLAATTTFAAVHPTFAAEDVPLADAIYLTFFSRYPSEQERAVAVAYLGSGTSGRQAAAEDLAWSMLNSLEFVFNH